MLHCGAPTSVVVQLSRPAASLDTTYSVLLHPAQADDGSPLAQPLGVVVLASRVPLGKRVVTIPCVVPARALPPGSAPALASISVQCDSLPELCARSRPLPLTAMRRQLSITNLPLLLPDRAPVAPSIVPVSFAPRLVSVG